MFLRKAKRSLVRELREAVWPSMGWRRAVLYYKHRLLRDNSSTHKVVGGLATGIGVSFSPLLGAHSFMAVFLGWVFGFNKLASWVGTGVGTPVTLPLMFWLDYELGVRLIGLAGYRKFVALPGTLTLHTLFAQPGSLLLPMLAGSLVLGVAAWFCAYALLYYPIHNMKKAYCDSRYRK